MLMSHQLKNVSLHVMLSNDEYIPDQQNGVTFGGSGCEVEALNLALQESLIPL